MSDSTKTNYKGHCKVPGDASDCHFDHAQCNQNNECTCAYPWYGIMNINDSCKKKALQSSGKDGVCTKMSYEEQKAPDCVKHRSEPQTQQPKKGRVYDSYLF